MYIYHLISIDLQLSRLFNPLHCKAYILLYGWLIGILVAIVIGFVAAVDTSSSLFYRLPA